MMVEKYVLDDHTALSLSNPVLKTSFPTEEQQHPWHTDRFQTFEMPFPRIWDRCSGSQPDENKSMIARAPHQRLDTIESQKISLAKHLSTVTGPHQHRTSHSQTHQRQHKTW